MQDGCRIEEVNNEAGGQAMPGDGAAHVAEDLELHTAPSPEPSGVLPFVPEAHSPGALPRQLSSYTLASCDALKKYTKPSQSGVC